MSRLENLVTHARVSQLLCTGWIRVNDLPLTVACQHVVQAGILKTLFELHVHAWARWQICVMLSMLGPLLG